MKKELFRRYARTFLVGILRSVLGTVAIATLTFGVIVCFYVTQESGYAAVGLFVAALLFIVCGLMQLYNCGNNITCGNKKGEHKK